MSGSWLSLCTSLNLSLPVKCGWADEQWQGAACPSKLPLLGQTQAITPVPAETT